MSNFPAAGGTPPCGFLIHSSGHASAYPWLWTAHGHRIHPEVHPRLLDPDDERDRRYWQTKR
ncbi:MAG: hypothetical protein ABIJ39_11245 [Chloroflexota bacterium]